MTAELIVYALLAAALIFWLRSILGTRSEDDPRVKIVKLELSEDGKVISIGSPMDMKEDNRIEFIDELIANEKGNMSIERLPYVIPLLILPKLDNNFIYTGFYRPLRMSLYL